MVCISPETLSLTSLVTVNISFKYFVPNALADSARFVKDAKTAKKVAFKCAGAFFAIQANRGTVSYTHLTLPTSHLV